MPPLRNDAAGVKTALDPHAELPKNSSFDDDGHRSVNDFQYDFSSSPEKRTTPAPSPVKSNNSDRSEKSVAVKMPPPRKMSSLAKDSTNYGGGEAVVKRFLAQHSAPPKNASSDGHCSVNGIQSDLLPPSQKRNSPVPSPAKPINSNQAEKSAAVQAAPLRKMSSKDSTNYGGNKSVGKRFASQLSTIPNDSSFDDGDRSAIDLQSGFIPSPRKRKIPAPAPVRGNNKVFKPTDGKCVYDFNEFDGDEHMTKKPRGGGRGGGRGRGRGGRSAQPKKRAKPAAFPRVPLPSVERRNNRFTIRPRTPVGKTAFVANDKKSTNISKIHSFAMDASKDDAKRIESNRIPIKHANDRAEKKKTVQREQKVSTTSAASSGMDKFAGAIKPNVRSGRRSINRNDESKRENRGDYNAVSDSLGDISIKIQNAAN